jgi:integrase
MGEPRPGELIFATERGRPLTDKMLLDLAKELRPGITVHGFRSGFRDWAAVRTSYSRDVIELALAHKIKGATEAAYWRDDALEKRRRLMDEWSRYSASTPAKMSGEVVSLHGAA